MVLKSFDQGFALFILAGSGPFGGWNEAKLGGIKTEVLSEDHKKTPTSSSGIETW